MAKIIGRNIEIEELRHSFHSKKAEFVVLYGRRRVGKTFLVNEVFRDGFAFHHTGLSPYDQERKNLMKDQLQNFQFSLMRYGLEGAHRPKSWVEAFFMLQKLLERGDNDERQVVFIDELPWMDTPRSGFVSALEGFWNGWGCSRDNLMLIVCGSATAWIQDKLIDSQGGLYDRITNKIKVYPFTLKECEEFYREQNIRMTRRDIVESYMILGGIPYYMSYFRKGYSLPQNIDRLFFAKDAKLDDEYNRLFGSIFTSPDDYKRIVELLATRRGGYTREEIAHKMDISNGGGLTTILKALAESGFIVKYTPFTTGTTEYRYKLVDHFCRYWLKFKEPNKNSHDYNLWQHSYLLPATNTWRGYAFEDVCFDHIPQIKNALGISGIVTEESAWNISGSEKKEGTQVDMLIKRPDNTINLCEMKYYKNVFSIDKRYHCTLENRIETLYQYITKRNMKIHLTIITTEGVKYNEYSGIVEKALVLDDLFS